MVVALTAPRHLFDLHHAGGLHHGHACHSHRLSGVQYSAVRCLVSGETVAVIQDPSVGEVGVITSTDWRHPAPWAAPPSGSPGHELIQWRLTNVNVTCARDDGAMERLAAIPRPPLPDAAVAGAQAGGSCYLAADRGESYRGPAAISESGRPCVPWGSIGQPAGANVLSSVYLPDSCVPCFFRVVLVCGMMEPWGRDYAVPPHILRNPGVDLGGCLGSAAVLIWFLRRPPVGAGVRAARSICIGSAWSMCIGSVWSLCIGSAWSICIGSACWHGGLLHTSVGSSGPIT